MAGMRSSKKTANVLESAPDCIMDILQPLLSALAEVKAGPETGPEQAPDSGLRFVVGSILRTLHDQVYGQITFRDRNGVPQSIQNAKQRFDGSDQAFRKLVQKHGGDDEALISDPEYSRIAGWLRVNEARFTAYKQLIDTFNTVYTACVGTSFEYTPRVQKPMEAAVLSAAEKAKRIAAAKELVARFVA